MDAKLLWKSKTFWFNVLSLLVLVASAFGFSEFQAAPEVGQIGTVVVIVLNIILRWHTTQPVTLSNKDDS